jgi:hypothetical protein
MPMPTIFAQWARKKSAYLVLFVIILIRPRAILTFSLPSPSFDSYMSIKFFLEDQLGRPVDLVILSDIKPRLKAQILDEVIYAERC